MLYERNKVFNKPQLILTHSGIFEIDKKNVLFFVDDILRNDKRRENLMDMFQPILTLELSDSNKNFNLNDFFRNIDILINAYKEYYNIIISIEDFDLLKEMIKRNYGKEEALVTGTTFEFNMLEDWRKKQGLFST